MENIFKVQMSVKSTVTKEELERALATAIQKQGVISSIHIQQLQLPTRQR